MKLSSTEDLEQISSGSNSSIFKLKKKEEEEGMVFKIVSIDNKRESDHLINEYQFLSTLHHQNIISPILFQPNVSFQGSDSNVLVLEYAHKGCLLDYIKKRTSSLTVQNARFIFGEVLSAVQYMHSLNIAHRDLKLQNVLVFNIEGELRFKLADFGFADYTVELKQKQDQSQSQETAESKRYQQKLVRGVKGTKRGYMAPEIHISLVEKQSYKTKNTDIFALGVMLFALIFRKLPFQYATKDNIIYQYLWQGNNQAFWDHHAKDIMKKEIENQNSCMDDLKHLLEGMLCRDPNSRFSIQEVLEHEWLQGEKVRPEI